MVNPNPPRGGNSGGRGAGRGGQGRGAKGNRGRSGRGQGGRGRGNKGLEAWDPANPGAFYAPWVYRSLTDEQKDLNKAARDQSGKSKSSGKRDKSKISKLKTKYEEMEAKLAALTSDLAVANAIGAHQGTSSVGALLAKKRKTGDTIILQRKEDGTVSVVS